MVGLNKRTGLMNTAIDVVQRDLAGAAPTQRSEAHIEEVWMGTDDVPAKATHDNAPARALEEDTVRVGRQLCRRVPEEKLTSWPPCLVPCCTARWFVTPPRFNVLRVAEQMSLVKREDI
jgi:hypothetical protein